MKILEINKFFFGGRGAERHFFDMIELLESHGNQVAVFAMQHPQNKPSRWSRYFLSQVGYNRSSATLWQITKGIGRMFYSPEAVQKINRLLDDFQPDIVHVHNIYHQLCPWILFEIKKRKIPIVMTIHDYKLINPNYNLFHDGKVYERCRDHRYYQCLSDRCIGGSIARSFLAMVESYWHYFFKTYSSTVDHYIVPSRYVRDRLAGAGIPQNSISIMPHFIADYQAETGDTISPEGDQSKYAFYFGSISKLKGVDMLVEIFSRHPDWKLYLAGKAEPELLAALPANIIYAGLLEKKELNKLIRNAACVVSPSRLPETFGLVALEAISQGTPFVGFSAAGAYPEIIQDGVNGLIAKEPAGLEAAIEKMLLQKVFFDRSTIIYQAEHVYNSGRYYGQFMDLCRRLSGNQKLTPVEGIGTEKRSKKVSDG